MDLFVLAVVLVLIVGGTVGGLLGLIHIVCYGSDNFTNYMTGFSSLGLGGGVMIAAVYTGIPWSGGEAYLIPIFFILVGLGFLIAAICGSLHGNTAS